MDKNPEVEKVWEVVGRELGAARRAGVDRIDAQTTNLLAERLSDIRRLVDDYRQTVAAIDEREAKQLERPEGIRKLRAEAKAAANRRLKELAGQAEAAASVLRAVTEAATLPKVDAAREALDRDELRLFADTDPDTLHRRIVDLASDPRREHLAAVAASSYGRTMLEARGVDPALAQGALRRTIAERAADHGTTDTARFAGEVYRRGVPAAEKAATAAYHAARMSIDSLDPSDGIGRPSAADTQR